MSIIIFALLAFYSATGLLIGELKREKANIKVVTKIQKNTVHEPYPVVPNMHDMRVGDVIMWTGEEFISPAPEYEIDEQLITLSEGSYLIGSDVVSVNTGDARAIRIDGGTWREV